MVWNEFRAEPGRKFRLKDHDPEFTAGYKSKEEAQKRLRLGVETLSELQDELYAQDNWSVLLIFQAMDAAGKDSTIRHVMSGVNPQGVQVYSFKAPSAEDLDHDFLWRTNRCLPERGRIGVFNRSYYEEVLIVRVHRKILEAQKLPPRLVTKKIWDERLEDINGVERYLARQGMVIRKFFLNVSKGEQRRRFLARLDEPEKHWKFSATDAGERAHWNEYQRCYEEMIGRTSTAHAPWFVIPADHKWFTRMVVADIIVDTLRGLKLSYPKVTADKKKEIEEARRLLGEQRTSPRR